MKRFLLVSAVVFSATLPVFAEIYTYRDANGAVAYVEDLGKVPAKYRSQATPLTETETISVMEAAPSSDGRAVKKRKTARAATEERNRFEGTIEMYVTTWCPVCKDAESYARKMGYQYVKYDIEKDREAKTRNDSYPGRGVPLVVVGNHNFRGFSADTLEYYLNK